MPDHPTAVNEEARYWNEEGGQRWVHYIARLERMLEQFSNHLIAALDVQAGEHVLDIGCGGGPTSAAYATSAGPAGRVLGVDISEVILNVARKRYAALKNLEFKTADAATYAFTPRSFDVITSRYGVMFFPQPEAAFHNIGAAAKPGARLRMLCWRSLEENPWMGIPARAAFTVLAPPEKPAPGTPGPFSLADPARIESLLGGAGFRDVTLKKINETIVLGSVDDALDWLTQMGPASRPLAEADAEQREAAKAAMREVLATHDHGAGVTFDGGAWLVSAVKA